MRLITNHHQSLQTWSTSQARSASLPSLPLGLTTTHNTSLQTPRTSQWRAPPPGWLPSSPPASPSSPAPSQSHSRPDDDVTLRCSGPSQSQPVLFVLIDLMRNVTLATLTFPLCPVTLSQSVIAHRKANGTKLIIADLCQPIHHWSFYLT